MNKPYEIPHSPTSVGGFDARALAWAVLVFVAANWAATQYCAWSFHYQPALGPPLLKLARASIYLPWSWAVWTYQTMFHTSAAPSVRLVVMKALGMAFLGVFVAAFAFYIAQHARVRRMAQDAKHLHGSAAWATARDVKKSGLLKSQHGVYVGAWNDRGSLRYLRHNGQDHVLVFAPTRTGKGVAIVLPTLLGSWFGSAVIYDIKGENWDKTAGFRSTLGPVFRFAPHDLSGSSRFNPLAEIRLDTERDVADAQVIALILVGDGASQAEPYWHNAAESFLTGCILHVCYAAHREGRTACLRDVWEALTEPGTDFRATLARWQAYPHRADGTTHPIVARSTQEMIDKEDRNFDGVMSQAQTALRVYSDPVVARNTSDSDFRLDDLVNFKNPVSLYLVIPAGQQERLRPLTRLLFTMLVNRLTEHMKPNKHRLLLLIDEFPSLKRMEIFEHALSYIAGYGIKALLIAQDIRQLEAAYGNKESIVSNCNVRVAFAPNTFETATLLSNMLGKQTVLHQAYSFSGKRFAALPASMNTSMAHQERPLLTADEIGRIRAPEKQGEGPDEQITAPGEEIVFVAGHRPILGTQLLYFANPLLLERSRCSPHRGESLSRVIGLSSRNRRALPRTLSAARSLSRLQ
jgi:type IV secretion system protein VirD4